MRTRSFGNTGLSVGAVGFGAQYLSLRGRPAEAEAIHTLRQVLARGPVLIDTADSYCLGPTELHHNERLIARAVAEAGLDITKLPIATKGGTVRTETSWEVDGSPEYLLSTIRESHEALGGKGPIFLWQHHWPDPRYSVTAVMKSVQRAVDEGLVRYVGVGNYSLDQIREARDVVNVVSVQSQFSLWWRQAEREGILDYCEKENMVFLPWRPMGGQGLAQKLGEIKPLAEAAHKRGVSPQRVMIAWQLAKSPAILPIPGSSKLSNAMDCLHADEVQLDRAEVAALNGLTEADLPKRDRPWSIQGSPPLRKR